MKPTHVAAVAIACVLIVSTFQSIDIPEFFKDSMAQLDARNEGLQNHADLQNRVNDVKAAFRNNQLDQRLDALDQRLADIDDEEAEVERQREILEDKLEAQKEHYKAIEAATKELDRQRLASEERLQRLKANRAARQRKYGI